MRPGIIVQYARTPERTGERVRSDVAGIIGFIPPERWPEGATSGDYIEVILHQKGGLRVIDQALFDDAAQTAAEAYFENGGALAHVFGVCIDSIDALQEPSSAHGVDNHCLTNFALKKKSPIIGASCSLFSL